MKSILFISAVLSLSGGALKQSVTATLPVETQRIGDSARVKACEDKELDCIERCPGKLPDLHKDPVFIKCVIKCGDELERCIGSKKPSS
jgi:hypothetical protein